MNPASRFTLCLVAVLVLAGCAGVPAQPSTPTNDAVTPGTDSPTPANGDATPATSRSTPVTSPSTPALEWESVTVSEVVDGDTMEVEYPEGRSDTIRLLGVDTPETHTAVSPGEFEGVPDTAAGRAWLRTWAGEASGFATERLAGRQVDIATDPAADRRGGFDRLLVYVRADGTVFNRQLLDRGYARLYDTQFSRRDAFASAEATARADGVGLWGFDGESSGATPTTTSDGPLVLVAIQANAPGDDHENLDGEYVTFEHRGTGTLDLSGWTVSDESGKTYTAPRGTTLDSGERVTLYSGSGTSNASALYWDHDGAVWNNGGDTVIVHNASGSVVLRHSYD